VVETVRFDNQKEDDKRSFRFHLPEGPYSFGGQLIFLIWGLELIAVPSREDSARVEFVMAPDRKVIQLEALSKWESQ
jgi:hypothetical protein